MYMIRIVIMLTTIIPSLDCCSTRTLSDRNPIDLHRMMDLSMEKPSSTQFPQEAPSSTPATPLTTAAQGGLSHGKHHRHSHANSGNGVPGGGTDEEGGNLKLNRSHGPTMQQIGEQQLVEQQPPAQDRRPGNGSTAPADDGPYKFMDEIIVLECVDWYRLEFCLNGGRCFLYPIMNHTLLSCECAGDYVGERCEAKTPEKIPPTIRPRFVLAKTIGGPLVFGLAFMDILLLLFLFCKNSNRN